WENIANESNSFDISVEMTIKAAMQGYRISQVPSVWINRQAGTSQFGMLKEFRNYVRWLLYATSRSPSRFFLLLAALSIFSLIIFGTRLLHPIFRDNASSLWKSRCNRRICSTRYAAAISRLASSALVALACRSL